MKQLIELHGGTVAAASEGAGRGATFRFTLPLVAMRYGVEDRLADKGRSAGKAYGAPAEHAEISGMRILVIDDEPDARNLVRRLLEDCNAIVTVGGSVQEAMACMEAARFDLLISDIGMPNEDGHSLIRRIRALPAERGGTIPAVALTAYARSEDRVKSLTAGFQVHLAKPVEPAELIAIVASLTNRPAPHTNASA